MLPYYVLLLLPIFIQSVSLRGIDNAKKNKFTLNLFFGMLLFLMMFRHKTVGNDTVNYMFLFDNIAYAPLKSVKVFADEFGFVLLNKAISLISMDSRFFIGICSIIIVLLIAPSFVRANQDAGLTISLYCIMSTFVMMFSGIRQMLAIGIGFVAYHFVKQKKILPYVLCVILAFTFHNSAIMLAFLYPIYHAKITKRWLYVVIPIMGAIFVFNREMFTVVAWFLQRYSRFEGTISSTGAYTMIILFVIFSVFSYVVPDERKMDEETIGLRNMLLLATAIQFFAPLHSLAMRMNYYYIIFIPLLMPKIIQCRSEKWSNVAILGRHCMVVFFLFYFFVDAKPGGGLHIFPYHFFWENLI